MRMRFLARFLELPVYKKIVEGGLIKMIDVSVKTLDGQNRSFSMPDIMSVKEFKEKIANSINIIATEQRLIFQGRVLPDDKLLKDCNVDGRVIHVVHKPPPSTIQQSSSTNTSSPAMGSGPPGGASNFGMGPFMGSNFMGPNQVSNIVSQVVSNMGDLGQNANIQATSSADGNRVDVHVHLQADGSMRPSRFISESRNRLNSAQLMVKSARKILTKLQNNEQMDEDRRIRGYQPHRQLMDERAAAAMGPQQQQQPDEDHDSTFDRSQDEDDGEEDEDEMDVSDKDDSESESTCESIQIENEDGSRVDPENVTKTAAKESEAQLPTGGAEGSSVDHEDKSCSEEAMSSSSLADFDPTTLGPEEWPPGPRVGTGDMEGVELPNGDRILRGGHCLKRNNEGRQVVHINHPPPRECAALMRKVRELNSEFEPFLTEYQQLMEEDPDLSGDSQQSRRTSTQRLCNLVNECLHYLSHAYHSLSDIMVDFGSTSPGNGGRQLKAMPYIIQAASPAAVIQQTIPVQAQFNITVPSSGGIRPSNTSAPSAATTSAPVTVTNSSTNTSATRTTSSTSTIPTANMTQVPNINAVRQPFGFGPPNSGFGPFGPPMPGMFAPPRGIRQNGTASSNPYMVVEVGPDSIMLNSVTAHVVSNGQNSTEAPTSGTSTDPLSGVPGAPPFLQGMLNSIAQGVAHRMTQGVNPASSTATTVSNTLPTTATSTRTTPAPSTGQGMTPTSTASNASNAFPNNATNITSVSVTSVSETEETPEEMTRSVMEAFNAMPHGRPIGQSMSNVDQTLPCQSRFFKSRGGARRTYMRNSNPTVQTTSPLVGQASGQPNSASVSSSAVTSTTTTATSTSDTSQPPFNLTGGHFGPEIPSRDPNIPAAGTTSGPPLMLNMGNLSEALLALLQRGNAANSSGEGTRRETQASDAVFAELVQGIGGAVSQLSTGQPATQTIAEFIGHLGHNYSVLQSEGFVNDLFMCFAQHLTFADIMTLLMGNATPLNKIQQPLQNFISDKVLRGDFPNEENINRAVERLINDMQDQLSSAVEGETLRSGIDYNQTLNRFLRTYMRALVRIIMDTSVSQNQFGQAIFSRFRHGLSEFVVLCRFCLQGNAAFERMVQGRVRYLSDDVNPMIEEWVTSITSQQIANFELNLGVSESTIQQYIVRTTKEDEGTKKSEAKESKSEKATGQHDKKKEAEKTHVTIVETPPNIAKTTPNIAKTTPNIAEIPVAGLGAATCSTSTTKSKKASGPVLSGRARNKEDDTETPGGQPDESWQSQVPQEWLPVILEDRQRQRQQTRQAPFSDAYMSGLPAKKRKIMKGSEDLSNSSTSIPNILQTAIQTSGVEQPSNLQQIQTDVANSAEVQTAYSNHVQNSVINRLQTDPDYSAKQFPSTEKLVKKDN